MDINDIGNKSKLREECISCLPGFIGLCGELFIYIDIFY
jgi:hypothetical protein